MEEQSRITQRSIGGAQLVAIAISCFASLYTPKEARASNQGYCFPQQDLSIRHVHYRDAKRAIDRTLGQSLQSRQMIVPGTAGAYRVERRQYQDLWLDLKVSTQEVEAVVATGPRAAMPNGVRVGATLADVSKRLRYTFKQEMSADLVWTPPLCEKGPYDWIFVGPQFTFKRENGEVRLQSIRIQRI